MGKTYATGRKRHPRQPNRKRRWPPERLIERAQTWAREHDGVPPTYNQWHPSRPDCHPDWEKVVWPSSFACFQAFGGWSAFLAAAGFAPRPAHRPREGGQ